MKKIVIIQLAMSVIAVASGLGSIGFGQNQAYGNMTQYFIREGGRTQAIGIPVNVDTGFDGGAIGLGIISAICFFCVVWIEITKFKAKN